MLFDFLLALAMEGAVTGAQQAALPRPLRALLMLLVTVFFTAVAAFMLVCTVRLDGGLALRLICLAVGAGCAVYLAVFLRRAWKIWKN